MKTVILIPARYASTRYPGKPLVKLTLPDGSRKSLIQMDLSRFDTAPISHLSDLPFEGQGAFPAQR